MHCFESLRFWAMKPKQLPFLDYSDLFLDADFEYILNYSSNVIKITNSGTTYYFKEAKKRMSDIRACVYEGIDVFFDEIVDNPLLKEKTLLALENKTNFRRLINMGQKNVRSHRLHRYLVSHDERCLGLPSPDSSKEKQQLRMLAFYLYGELQSWYYNVNVKSGELQTFSSARSLCSWELARLIGVESVIVPCCFAKIRLNGKEKYGILSEQAVGDTLTTVPCEQRAIYVTPQLLRELTNLNLLDVLSRENDHRVGNFHIVSNDEALYVSVKAFDNDSPDCFALSANVGFSNVSGCSGMIDHKGMIRRAHLDKYAAQALLRLEKSHLKALKPYLGDLQLAFLWLRVRRVKKAVNLTLHKHEDFLLAPNEWREEHIMQDRSGQYGKTYLVSLLTDAYFETGMHDFDTL